MTDLYFYRDPESEENKNDGEDENKPGVDDVGAGAVNEGFNSEWEVSGGGAGAFAAASNNTAGAQPEATWDAEGADFAAGQGNVETGNEGWNDGTPAAGIEKAQAGW